MQAPCCGICTHGSVLLTRSVYLPRATRQGLQRPVRSLGLTSVHFEGRRVAVIRCCIRSVGVLSLSDKDTERGPGAAIIIHTGMCGAIVLGFRKCANLQIKGRNGQYSISIKGWVHSRCTLMLASQIPCDAIRGCAYQRSSRCDCIRTWAAMRSQVPCMHFMFTKICKSLNNMLTFVVTPQTSYINPQAPCTTVHKPLLPHLRDEQQQHPGNRAHGTGLSTWYNARVTCPTAHCPSARADAKKDLKRNK